MLRGSLGRSWTQEIGISHNTYYFPFLLEFCAARTGYMYQEQVSDLEHRVMGMFPTFLSDTILFLQRLLRVSLYS